MPLRAIKESMLIPGREVWHFRKLNPLIEVKGVVSCFCGSNFFVNSGSVTFKFAYYNAFIQDCGPLGGIQKGIGLLRGNNIV